MWVDTESIAHGGGVGDGQARSRTARCGHGRSQYMGGSRSRKVVDGVAGDEGALVAGVRETSGAGFGGEVDVFGRASGNDVGGMGNLGHAMDVAVVAVVDKLEADVAVLTANRAEEALVCLERDTVADPIVAVEGRDVVGVEECEQRAIGGDDRLGELAGVEGASKGERAAREAEGAEGDQREGGDHGKRVSREAPPLTWRRYPASAQW